MPSKFSIVSFMPPKACVFVSKGSVTRLPGIIIPRYLGGSSEAARRYFVALWRILCPALAGREVNEPGIWRT